MFYSNEEGKKLTQGIFCKGKSFGEPPLFINQPYPFKAVSLQEGTFIKLSKDKFIKIIDEYPTIQKSFLIL